MASTISAGTTSGTAIAIAGDTTGALALQTNNGTTAVTIDTSQRVLINATSASGFDSGADNLIVGAGSGSNGITIYSGNTSTAAINFADGTTGSDIYAGGITYNHNTNNLDLATTDGSTRMRITSGGNFLVGGTTTIGDNGILLANADYTATYRSTGTAGAYVHAFASDIGGTRTVKYAVYANGTVGAVSDQNLKKNIEPARNYLTDLMNIEVVKYNWISDSNTDHKELGYIAQQVETVFPSMVDEHTYNDGNGNSVTQKMLKKEVFIPMMLKAIQELNAKVDAQAITIAELQARTT